MDLSEYYDEDSKYKKPFDGLRSDPDGTLVWNHYSEDKANIHRELFIIKPDIIKIYHSNVSKNASNNGKNGKVGEQVLGDIISIFGDDIPGSSDMAMNMEHNFDSPGNLRFFWEKKTKNIKSIELKRDTGTITLKAFMSSENLSANYPEDFDTIVNRLKTFCPNATVIG